MRKIDWGTLGIVALWIIVLAIIAAKAKAQDTAPTVCKFDDHFEFRNIPQSWVDNGYWYQAETSEMDGSTFIAYPIRINSNGVVAGTATIGNSNYSVILTGDENTPLCDPAPTPEPTQAPVVEQAVSQSVVMSTGRTCAIQYPKIILVCS